MKVEACLRVVFIELSVQVKMITREVCEQWTFTNRTYVFNEGIISRHAHRVEGKGHVSFTATFKRDSTDRCIRNLFWTGTIDSDLRLGCWASVQNDLGGIFQSLVFSLLRFLISHISLFDFSHTPCSFLFDLGDWHCKCLHLQLTSHHLIHLFKCQPV